MKKAIYTITLLIALVMLMSESDNFTAQVLWTSAGLFLLWFSGRALSNILNKEDANE